VFDLTPFRSAYTTGGRRTKLIVGVMGASWAAFWLIAIEQPRLSVPSLDGAQWLVLGLSPACVALFEILLFDRIFKIPSSLTIDSRGVTLNYDSGKSRTYDWKGARSWFYLADLGSDYSRAWLPRGGRPIVAPVSRYCVTRIRTVAGMPLYIPEVAFGLLLSEARGADIQIRTYEYRGGRATAWSTVFYVPPR